MSIFRRVAGWLVTRRALLAELANVERLARDRQIALLMSEAARVALEQDNALQREAVSFWEQVQ